MDKIQEIINYMEKQIYLSRVEIVNICKDLKELSKQNTEILLNETYKWGSYSGIRRDVDITVDKITHETEEVTVLITKATRGRDE